MSGTEKSKTIGILYPGEMGAAIGRLLAENGCRVVTTAEGRSSRTTDLAAAAGLRVLQSLEDVVADSQTILSLVPPAAAVSTARRVAECAQIRPEVLYIDANSIASSTTHTLAGLVEARGMRFVDAAIHGQARRLATQGILFLSGPNAAEAADLFEGVLRTRWLGAEVGRASTMKMLLSGISKGMVALFLELAVAARDASLLDEFLARCGDFYPGLLQPVSRMLPTYPRHVARRADEMGELEDTLAAFGLQSHIASAVRRLMMRLAESDLHQYAQAVDDGLFELDDLIELIASLNLLRTTDVSHDATIGSC